VIWLPGSSRAAPVRISSGFTLLELLLTLSVIAAIAAVALPQASGLLGDRRLARAADQLQAEMTRLRVDAMREGRVMMLEAMTEGNSVRIRPYYSLSDSTEAIDQTGSQSALLNGATQGVNTAMTTESPEQSGRTIELPDEIQVAAVGVVSAARSAEIEQQNAGSQSAGWSRPVLFYPDGSTSTAIITLMHPTMGQVQVRIRGITGEVRVGEIKAAER